MTIEQPDLMTEREAHQITERIRAALDRVSTAWADLSERITEAYQRRADLALGYGSWAEYAEAELRPTEGLAVEVRRQLVGMLTAAGMSTRAIAPAVGVSNKTVSIDRREVLPEVTPTSTPQPAERVDPAVAYETTVDMETLASTPVERIDHETGEITEAAPAQPAPRDTVVGLDGKTYTRPEPKPSAPKRRPITDQFFDAAYDVNRRIESLHRLTTDDRFPQSANKVAQKHLRDLIASRDLLQQVINQLS